MGESRKYSYHTTGSILEFWGMGGGGFFDWNYETTGKRGVMQFGLWSKLHTKEALSVMYQ